MIHLILSLLSDRFGVSGQNLKTLLQIFEDECGQDEACELEDKVASFYIDGYIRYRIPT